MAVIALNVPVMVLGITRGYDVLSLFLITNLLCCCAAFPVGLGLLRSRGANRFFTETGCIFGVFAGVLGGPRAPCSALRYVVAPLSMRCREWWLSTKEPAAGALPLEACCLGR